MAPPDTNLAKQKRRHRPVFILLLAAVLVFLIAALMIPSTELGVEPGADASSEVVNE